MVMQIVGHRTAFHKMNISGISLLKYCSCYTSQLNFLCYVWC